MIRVGERIPRELSLGGLLGLCFLLIVASPASSKEPSDRDKELIAKVAVKFFEKVDPIEGWAWPPLVAVSDTDEMNAYADIMAVKPGEKPKSPGQRFIWIDIPFPVRGTNPIDETRKTAETAPTEKGSLRKQPFIIINQGYLDKLILGRELILAQIFSHEFSHIMRRHVESLERSDSSIVSLAFSREQEYEADMFGLQLALKADYRYDEIIAALKEKRRILKSYSSVISLGVSHPGWTDRIEAIDEKQSQLWPSIAAFENGVFFLLAENYQLAERCFSQVVQEMPGCYEAWANRGYCRLMIYCDQLSPDEIRELGLNQVVVGGFYQRPSSIDERGAKKEDIWFQAVGDFREALKLKETLILPKANLALAYLVAPEGKQPGRAAELYEQVIAALKKGSLEEELAQRDYAALLVNAGVTELANGNARGANQFFDQVVSIYKTTSTSAPTGPVQSAILYSRAHQMASSVDANDRRDAVSVFEEYLRTTSPSVTWWGLAYERYKTLCSAENVPPKSREELARLKNLKYRPVISLAVGEGKTLSLNDKLTSVLNLLGEGTKSPLVRNSNVHRRRYNESGLELVCSDRLIAIRMRSSNSPPLILTASGPGGIVSEIKVGMPISELERLLTDESPAWDNRYGTQRSIVYHYYPRLGFGVLVNDDDKISEIIIAQLPPESIVK
jgi:tetratricopeptide (TPR) repeat protein